MQAHDHADSSPPRELDELHSLLRRLSIAAGSGGQRNDTRSRLLQAAIGMFAQEGFAATTMRSLASAVGITGGAIYSHFPSKEAVLSAALASIYAEFLLEVLGVDDHELSAEDRLEQRLGRHLRFQVSRRPLASASDSLFSNPSVMTLIQPDVRGLLENSRRYYFDAIYRDVVRASPPSSGLFHDVQTRSLLSLSDSIYQVPGIVDGSADSEGIVRVYLTIMRSILRGLPTGRP